MTPQALIAEIAAHNMLTADALATPFPPRHAMAARDEAALRLYLDFRMSAGAVARALGLKEHSTARDCILRRAAALGLPAHSLWELRATTRPGAIDWTKFAYRVAGWMEGNRFAERHGAEAAGIARATLRDALHGRRLTAESFTLLCWAMNADARDFLQGGHLQNGRADVSRKSSGEPWQQRLAKPGKRKAVA